MRAYVNGKMVVVLNCHVFRGLPINNVRRMQEIYVNKKKKMIIIRVWMAKWELMCEPHLVF